MRKDKSTKTVWKLFFAWEDEKEERWLAHMAQQGWHLRSFNFCKYTFAKGSAQNIVYRLDYQHTHKIDREEYLNIFKDAGWEYVTQFVGWFYFRTHDKDGTWPQIYTDPTSRIEKYRRLLSILVFVLMLNLIGPLLTLSAARARPEGIPASIEAFAEDMRLISFVVLVLLGYACLRILIRIGQLKRHRS